MVEKILYEGLTFDDLLIIPNESNVLPSEVETNTLVTRNIGLNIPLVSAAMDSVTESELAIALAREGGIGIIHKNMSISRQAAEIDRVKRSESGMILNPVTLEPENRLEDAQSIMKKFKISGIPIVKNNKLVGILTNRDLRFEEDMSRSIDEIMTHGPLVTAPLGTTLEQAKSLLQKHKIEKLLIVDENQQLKGLITVKDIQKKKKYPRAAKDSHGRLRVGAAVGVTKDSLRRVAKLMEVEVDVVVVDTAHGHSKGVIEAIKLIKLEYPHLELIAGNVATYDGAKALIDAGVDAVKVGVGPGAICTTRVVTGVGVPQITAIYECAKACQANKIPLIADGGIKQHGDIAKAIVAGADTVMIGNLFAGTAESPGEMIFLEGRSFKVYRGMGSIEAMKKGSKDRYFQEGEADSAKLVPEGIEGRVPYRGSLNECVYQMIGGLRAAMGYTGARNIQELQTKGRFVRMTFAGLRESHPHDVTITKEAPNYSMESGF
jgi:IMP dehydrogenase